MPATLQRPPSPRPLESLRPHVREGRYRIGSHAARHALAEGFTERDIVMTLLHGRELARYLEDQRLLVLGWLPAGRSARLPLHVVVETKRPRWADVVTAFIPHDPHRVVSRQRLALLLRPDDKPRLQKPTPKGAGRASAR
jgi:hypothetical protein